MDDASSFMSHHAPLASTRVRQKSYIALQIDEDRGRETKRWRERERQRGRETKRERGRETKRERGRETKREREDFRNTERYS
jgi:hypothetical protein